MSEQDSVVASQVRSAALAAEFAEQTRQLLERVAEQVECEGFEAVSAVLTLSLLGRAKGNSRGELDHLVQRYRNGLPANASILVDPHSRFPIEVVGTGAWDPLQRPRT